jgi:hypothetical protein
MLLSPKTPVWGLRVKKSIKILHRTVKLIRKLVRKEIFFSGSALFIGCGLDFPGVFLEIFYPGGRVNV